MTSADTVATSDTIAASIETVSQSSRSPEISRSPGDAGGQYSPVENAEDRPIDGNRGIADVVQICEVLVANSIRRDTIGSIIACGFSMSDLDRAIPSIQSRMNIKAFDPSAFLLAKLHSNRNRSQFREFVPAAASPKIEKLATMTHMVIGPPNPQKPSIGRVVHYVLLGGASQGEHRPALIVKVEKHGSCWLNVMKARSDDFSGEPNSGCGTGSQSASSVVSYVFEDASGLPGTWHWPERAS